MVTVMNYKAGNNVIQQLGRCDVPIFVIQLIVTLNLGTGGKS
jgi:hypothetical protein